MATTVARGSRIPNREPRPGLPHDLQDPVSDVEFSSTGIVSFGHPGPVPR